MGCDMHSHVELRDGGGWSTVVGIDWGKYDDGPFEARSYSVYGWMAGVRNYSAVEPLSEPRGIPEDVSSSVREDYDEWREIGCHSASWFSLPELLAVDYDQEVNDRRVTRQVGPNAFDGGQTGEPEEGEIEPLRSFLGAGFMRDLDTLAAISDPERVRVVFWFDN